MHTNNNSRGQDTDESLLQQLISKYLPYWPIFLIALIVGTGVAYAYISYATPIYEADATLIIKDEKKGNEDSKMMESLDQISSKKIVENEIEVIQSRRLMSDVVDKLGLYAPIFEKGKIKSSSAYLTAPVSISVPAPDSITGSDKIKLSFARNSNSVLINDSFRYPLNQIVNTRFGRMEFLA